MATVSILTHDEQLLCLEYGNFNVVRSDDGFTVYFNSVDIQFTNEEWLQLITQYEEDREYTTERKIDEHYMDNQHGEQLGF